MPVIGKGSPEALRINAALSAWRQGDVALKERWFIHAAMPTLPLTAEADTGGDDELAAITSEVAGLVVVSQACDIARECDAAAAACVPCDRFTVAAEPRPADQLRSDWDVTPDAAP